MNCKLQISSHHPSHHHNHNHHTDDTRYRELLQQYRAESLPTEVTSVLTDFFLPTQQQLLELSRSNDHHDTFMVVDGDGASTCNNDNNLMSFTKDTNFIDVNECNNHLPTTSTAKTMTSSPTLDVFDSLQQTPIKSITDQSDEDIPDDVLNISDRLYAEHFADGCGCTRRCHERFDKRITFQAHLDSLDLDTFCPLHVNHQHLLLLGAMNALLGHKSRQQSKDCVVGGSSGGSSTSFRFRGQEVCRKFFLYVFGCGLKRLKNVMKQFRRYGIAPKLHDGAGVVKSLMKMDANRQRRNALVYILHYAQQNALQLPGRYVDKPDNLLDLYLLPAQANISRRYIYDHYQAGCAVLHLEPISFALWNTLWDLQYPNIWTLTDRSDELCYDCRQYRKNLLTNTNTSHLGGSSSSFMMTNESSTLATTERYLQHLRQVQAECVNYHTLIDQCKQEYEETMKKTDLESTIRLSCFISTLSSMHYTFDWYWTISLPYTDTTVRRDPAIYFKSGYKVALFGVTIEPIKKFIFYIVPEFVCHHPDTLPNITISLMHHFFSIFRFNEKISYCHFANSSLGQAKNNLLLSYFIWRSLTGLTDRVQLSFLPPGHTRCWNDLFGGVFKKKLRNCQVSSLQEIKSIAERCTLDYTDITEVCCVEEVGEENSDPVVDTGGGGGGGGTSSTSTTTSSSSLSSSSSSSLSSSSSSTENANLVQAILVGDDDEKLLLPLYNWQDRFASTIQHLNPTILASNQHFEINIDLPGFVLCRAAIDSEIVSYKLVSNLALSLIDQELPNKLVLEPISHERRKYLNENISSCQSESTTTATSNHQQNFINSKRKILKFSPKSKHNKHKPSDDATTIKVNKFIYGNKRINPRPVPPPPPPNTALDHQSSSIAPSSVSEVVLESERNRKSKIATKRCAPKCGYCNQTGHRESIFGKVRCPKKRKDCAILDLPSTSATTSAVTTTTGTTGTTGTSGSYSSSCTLLNELGHYNRSNSSGVGGGAQTLSPTVTHPLDEATAEEILESLVHDHQQQNQQSQHIITTLSSESEMET